MQEKRTLQSATELATISPSGLVHCVRVDRPVVGRQDAEYMRQRSGHFYLSDAVDIGLFFIRPQGLTILKNLNVCRDDRHHLGVLLTLPTRHFSHSELQRAVEKPSIGRLGFYLRRLVHIQISLSIEEDISAPLSAPALG